MLVSNEKSVPYVGAALKLTHSLVPASPTVGNAADGGALNAYPSFAWPPRFAPISTTSTCDSSRRLRSMIVYVRAVSVALAAVAIPALTTTSSSPYARGRFAGSTLPTASALPANLSLLSPFRTPITAFLHCIPLWLPNACNY